MEASLKMEVKINFKAFLLGLLCSALFGCAASDVSRDAASDADTAYQDTSTAISNIGRDNLTDAYQNSTQTTKGAVIGGATGAVAGSLTSGLGLFPGAAGGAVFGGLIGAYIDRHTTLTDQLENRGVKVIVLGDQVLIVVPSARLFQGATPKIKFQAYDTLNLVAKFINQYTTMSVKVSAFTNDSGFPPEVNHAISQQQADNVVRYLWTQLNTRLLSGKGCGGTQLMAKNNAAWDRGDNYRIEITLEKLPV